ncbi:hypothetical protein KA078_02960 [Candidatus Woesebacteria bacterium]|nr:hypothetical protein [Candidatus Woesebacteria bacterium]
MEYSIRRFIDRIKPRERVEHPSSYSLEECISELERDGFTISDTLKSDIARFGLNAGIVLALDGNCGLRVDKQSDGEAFVIRVYNGLKDGQDHLSKLARDKYNNKPIYQQLPQQ